MNNQASIEGRMSIHKIVDIESARVGNMDRPSPRLKKTFMRGKEKFTRSSVYQISADEPFRLSAQSIPATLSLTARLTRFLLVAASGHFVTGVVSTLVLSLALAISGYSLTSAWQVFLAWGAIRIGLYLFSGPVRIFTSPLVRKSTKSLIQVELLLFLLLAASGFLFGLPTDRFTLFIFGTLNIFSLVLLSYASRAGMNFWRAVHTENGTVQLEKQVIIVGTGDRAKNIADTVLSAPELNTSLRGFLDYHRHDLWRYRDVPLMGHPDAVRRIIAEGQVDAIIIAVDLEDLPQTKSLFTAAEEMGVTIYLLPDMYQQRVARSEVGSIDGTATYVYRSVPDNRGGLIAKSVIDRIGALAALIITSPVMIATAIAIKLDSHGPVMFKQRRCGKNGRVFEIFKFRTMCSDAEAKKKDLSAHNQMSGPVFKMKADPRITKVGRFLRKYSIDELPQLFNVLFGEMSLVGPRPPLPTEVINYEPWQHRKLSVRPGLTCIWQVNGRNTIDFEDWMRLDLQYIDNWSLWQDAKILAKTIPTVLKGSGL